MTPQSDSPRSTASGPIDASTTTLRHEVLERGRRLVAARDPRTGAWRLYSVSRHTARDGIGPEGGPY